MSESFSEFVSCLSSLTVAMSHFLSLINNYQFILIFQEILFILPNYININSFFILFFLIDLLLPFFFLIFIALFTFLMFLSRTTFFIVLDFIFLFLLSRWGFYFVILLIFSFLLLGFFFFYFVGRLLFLIFISLAIVVEIFIIFIII